MKSGNAGSGSFLAFQLGTALIALSLLAGSGFAQVTGSSGSNAQDNSSSGDKSGDKKDDKSSQPATTKIQIHVTSKDGKPISEASVYVRFNESGGFLRKDKLAEMDLKTNQDGSVKVPEIPQGKIMIQVIATGW